MRRHLPQNPSDDVGAAVEDFLTDEPAIESNELAESPYEYDVQANLQDRLLTITLTLKAEQEYCCHRPSCHLGFEEDNDDENWQRLRDVLDGYGLNPRRPLTLKCQIVVESATRFDGSCDPFGHGQPFVAQERMSTRDEFQEER